jgi:aryl-alcohol dehydrogenase-like predicted oxidoreductase
LGLGTARLGGLGWHDELVPQGLPQVKEDAIRQIRKAVDLGVTLFDTAESYGQGWCESIIGKALRGRRENVTVVTKFGENPLPDQDAPWYLDASIVSRKCEDSLRRLNSDCIDLYLLHRRDYPLTQAAELVDVLEILVQAGKIRYYGWSTDDVERARIFAGGKHCIAIEHRLNVFNDHPAMLDLCQEFDLASLCRVPLLMGVLTGRWSAETKLQQDDPRAGWFEHEEFRRILACARKIEPYLTRDGRSVVQGALAWIWARSPLSIPLPGFRHLVQLQELVHAQQFGPLQPHAMQAIAEQVQSLGII